LGDPAHRAVVVCAPPGAGATTLAAHWARDRTEGALTWCAGVAAGDVDLGPAGGCAVVDGIVAEDPAAVIRALVDTAVATGVERLVVLLHHEVAEALVDLRVAGTVLVVAGRDLVLTPTELAELVRLVSGHAVAGEVAGTVTAAIGGWMAGAVEVARRWDPAVSRADHHVVLRGVYDELAVRVARVVADATDDDELEALRHAAVLPALSPDLWDQVLGRADGATVLDRLRRAGAFVADSPRHPGLVQLHPLAAAGLRSEAEADDPETKLLEAAATWFGEHQLPLMAARCHVALDDWDAVGLDVFTNLFDLLSEDRLERFVEFVTEVPVAVLQERYHWGVGVSVVLLTLGRIEVCQALFDALGPPPSPEMEVIRLAHLAAWATYLEDPRPCLDGVERGLEVCDELGDDHVYADLFTTSRTRHWRVQLRSSGLASAAYLGEWARFDALAAPPVDAASMLEIPAQSGLMPTLGRRAIGFALAGRLVEASEAGGASLGLEHLGTTVAQTASARIALGDVALLQGRAEEAEEGFRRALELQEAFGPTSQKVHAAVGLAELRLDRADPTEALADLAAHLAPDFRPPHTLRARVAAARALAEHRLGRSVAAATELATAPRTAALAGTAVLIALEQGRIADAQRWLVEWPDEPIPLARVLEPTARGAVAEWSGNRPEAVEYLRQALAAGADDQLLQPIARFAVLTPRALREVAQEDGVVGRTAIAVLGLLDPIGTLADLTDRERLVLHHLGMAAPLREVARRLVISPNTLRTQTRAIYRKLGVGSRAAAVDVLRGA
jgi:LuxR family maltose regulon positive regulatory protein